jgi:peptidylprolyl isomerase
MLYNRDVLRRRKMRTSSLTQTLVVSGLALLAVLAASSCEEPKYPEGLYAEVTTNKGLIVLQLEFEKTPMTVASFVGLAEGKIENEAFPPGRPYFDGTAWHRVVPRHVIQCGIPKSDRAKGPGYQFPNEIVLPDLNHGRAGMVNMANGGPHTNASQWCITLGDRSYLDGDYTVFGHVHEGLEAVLSVVQDDVIQTVKIVRVGKKARAFKPTTESFKAMVAGAEAGIRKAEAEKKAREEELLKAKWPSAVDDGSGLKVIVLKEGKGAPPAAGATVTAVYSGNCLLADRPFFSTADEGKPNWGPLPQPFTFVVGTTKVNPGVDAAIARMKKGERRLLIVPADQGYKTSGFYAREMPYEPRFVISPDTLLVYELEILDIVPPKK